MNYCEDHCTIITNTNNTKITKPIETCRRILLYMYIVMMISCEQNPVNTPMSYQMKVIQIMNK